MPANNAFNQLFAKEITTRVFDSNKYLEFIPDFSEYLSYRTVSIPATSVFTPSVSIDGTISDIGTNFVQTQEQFVTFTCSNYRLQPIVIEKYDEIVTSYDKMAFVTKETTNMLSDVIGKKVLNALAVDVDATRKIFTTGPVGNGNGFNGEDYNTVQWADIVNIKKAFDKDQMPAGETERFLLMDEEFYAELLLSDNIVKQLNFNVQDEGLAKTGAIATLAGLSIILKPSIASMSAGTNGNVIDAFVYSVARSVPAGHRRVALAFAPSALAMALSEPRVYTRSDDPMAFGSIVSSEITLGVVNKRKTLDNKGVYLLAQV